MQKVFADSTTNTDEAKLACRSYFIVTITLGLSERKTYTLAVDVVVLQL